MAKSKGSYYKIKSKDYFKALGYTVEYLEKLQRIVTKEGRVVFIKRDLLGADGLAVNDEEFILWQSVLGRSNLAEHIKRFRQFPCPPSIKRWIIIWELRVREPDIVDIADVKKEET